MNKDKLQKLKEVIRASNHKLIVMKVKISEKEFAQIANGTDSFDYTKYLVYPDITISNVLVALGKKKIPFTIYHQEEATHTVLIDSYNEDFYWNILHDDLDWHAKNRPETIKFLTEILL